jgi:hypothetical protein
MWRLGLLFEGPDSKEEEEDEERRGSEADASGSDIGIISRESGGSFLLNEATGYS